jgi:hypothetical protein
MSRIGPIISCGACQYEHLHRDRHYRTAPTVLESNDRQLRLIGESLATPAWCPLRKQAIAEAVDEIK